MLKEQIWKIRLLNESEINNNSEIIKKLISNCIENTYSISDLVEFINGKYESLIKHTKYGNAYPIGAYVKNKLVGFLWAYEIQSISYKAFHIAYVSVLENYRGCGIAKEMLQFCENESFRLGINKFELIVGANNVNAISFYQKTGFVADRITLIKNLVKRGKQT